VNNLQIAFRNKGDWGNNLYLDNINLDNQSGIVEQNESYLMMFPNPINRDGLLTLKTIPYSKIRIVDIHGRLVQETKGEGTVTINLNNLKSGTYIVCIESATQIWNKPLIVK
jgi:hypothetical protein